ncbi:alpha-amylase [Pseudobutyrivibrio sp. ACV-2]|uniref:starch-binding protein n=1 Tax=Pseudobutyrivibrio sp. ACV-2 TaxID=1520801 RepID=UPI00089443D1|nr:starch-binding protein [Pseudobutyrivibrio sp. ACV-2]SEA64743.1 alpha-amylase [Pseudobutyrivibrio sp. ACV-2]
MKKMKKATKKVVALGMTFAMLAGVPGGSLKAFAANGQNSNQTASAVSRSSIHDGAILHAFSWNFNTIKEKMPEIAAAGYTAVQTSPINECLSIYPGLKLNGTTNEEGKWYFHYQPTDWVIGNYQLGSRDEFKAMCDEAEKYGVGVIVDIDPNHTTPTFDQVSQNLIDAAGDKLEDLYHIGKMSGDMNYSDRVSVTYDVMGGLPDVDTENPGFQQYFYEFLNDCIACGADGFRIDTAKHIALPDDGVAKEYEGQEDRNNFYPNMKTAIDEYGSKDYADLFVYGEVLDGDASRLAAYQDMLGGTCASNYGGTIRNAVDSQNVSVKSLSGYKISDDTSTGNVYKADSNKLVTWVESHDNYINDKSYNEIDDTEVILGWAIITARADGTPLFFSRPDGSSASNPFGNNLIGPAGSDIYKAPEVVAVNKFRTAMEGEAENLRNPSGNSSVLMIERGDKGVVIVNASDANFELDSETNLADGTYIDSVEGHDSLYTVVEGNMFGTVPAKSVVVLDTLADGDYSTLFFHNTNHWSSVSADALGTDYPAEAQAYDWYKVTIPAEAFTVVFKGDGEQSAEFNITKDSGKYMTAATDKLYGSKAEAEEDLGITTKTVYFLNTEEWRPANAYAWLDDGTQLLGGWPGMAAQSDEGYWVKTSVKYQGDEDFSIIFNGDDGQTVDVRMDDMSKNYIAVTEVKDDGKREVTKFASKAEAEEATGIGSGTITVHYYDAAGWGKVGVYTWGDAQVGEWPGKLCEDEGDGWYKATINAGPSSNLNIIFNNYATGDEEGHQTDDMRADSLKNVYFIGASYKYGSKTAALKALESGTLKLQKGDPTPTTGEKVDREIGEEAPLADDETRVYIKLDDEGYAKGANLYCWTEGDKNVEYFGGWPGKAMTHIGNNWYSINVKNEMLFSEEKDLEEELLESEDLEEEELEEALTEEDTDEESTDVESEDADVTDEETAETETETEDAAEAEEDSESLVEEITDTLASFFNVLVSAFSPLEAQAADYQLFKDGIHLITNNNDGFQEDDVQVRFTTVRPSESELNPVKEEPVEVEPETPAPSEPATEVPTEPETPAPETPAAAEPVVTPSEPVATTPATSPESNNNGSQTPAQPAASTGNSSNAGASAPQSASQSTSVTTATSAPTTVAIADTQTPTAAPEITVASQPTKTAAATPKKTKSVAVKSESTNDENVSESEETVEADSKLEDEVEDTAEEVVDETTTADEAEETIEEEAVPQAAVESGFNPAILIAIILVVAAAGAAGVVVYRKK